MTRLVRLLTVQEVAELLGTPAKRVYELPIRKRRVGVRGVRYHPDDVIAYLDRPAYHPHRRASQRAIA